MDYKITFEDDSSGCLVHYGVKGMKWGVWNAETSARYKGGLSDRQKATISGATNAAIELVKSGGNPLVGGLSFASAYTTSRMASAAIKAGSPLVDKLVKDPSKRDKAHQRFEDRVNAAALGTTQAVKTLALTGGNLPAAGLAFGANYAASRISSSASRAGRPLVDKLVKDPTKREIAYKATGVALTVAASAGLTKAGSAAVGALTKPHPANPVGSEATATGLVTLGHHVKPMLDPIITPHAHSLPGNLVGVQSKPHVSVSQPSSGVSSQLSNANIPQSLLNQGVSGTTLHPVHTGITKPHATSTQPAVDLVDQLLEANIPDTLKKRF